MTRFTRPMIRSAGMTSLALVIVGVLVAACSAAGTATPAAGGLTVEGAWARPAPKTANAGAAYLVVKNAGTTADALISATSPVSGTAEVHETYVIASPSGAMPAASGAMAAEMMGMRPVARIDIPAGGSIELKPGGYHIMLMGLKQELVAGTTISLTLTFEKAPPITATLEVRAN
jgi:periplasmic copper chaperone A